MKILTVEDNASKLGKLIEVLNASGISREDISVARSAVAAIQLLEATKFDIAIIDLMLPNRDEDEEKLETSLRLIDFIANNESVIKPEHLVGFTAYSEAELAARPAFTKSLWTIIRFDASSTEWQEQVQRLVSYVSKCKEASGRPEYGVDLCVVTALQAPEMDSIHKLAWSWDASEPLDDSQFVRRGQFQSNGQTFSVISATAPRMGNVAAALLSSKLIQHYRPRFLVMAGICAAIKGKANMGDAILFNPAWEWASGKIVAVEEGSYLEPAPHQLAIPEFIAARMEELRKDGSFWLSIKQGHAASGDTLPKMVLGPGASGPSVVAHAEHAESIKLQHRKLSAIDMEAYGVMAAASFASSPKPTCFVLKSACDFADEEKDKKYQDYAAYTSAQSIREFFERFGASIRDLAGT
ncbi:MAG: hypothetical protein Q8Q73_16395 [Stagnimonas sp.]|nr:hypothetical protein [Stagnimonas sp.]